MKKFLSVIAVFVVASVSYAANGYKVNATVEPTNDASKFLVKGELSQVPTGIESDDGKTQLPCAFTQTVKLDEVAQLHECYDYDASIRVSIVNGIYTVDVTGVRSDGTPFDCNCTSGSCERPIVSRSDLDPRYQGTEDLPVYPGARPMCEDGKRRYNNRKNTHNKLDGYDDQDWYPR